MTNDALRQLIARAKGKAIGKEVWDVEAIEADFEDRVKYSGLGHKVAEYYPLRQKNMLRKIAER